MQNLILTLTLSFENDGRVDASAIADNIDTAIQRAINEGVLTPDDDGHATYATYSITQI